MLYEFPKGKSFTDLAIYVDSVIGSDFNSDVSNTVFQYLYHLGYMLSKKLNFFTDAYYYDDFSIFVATRVFERITRKDLPNVKSCLNYLKSIIYPTKVDFEQMEYCQVYSEVEDKDVIDYSKYSVSSYIEQESAKLEIAEIDVCLTQIDKTIKNYLKHIPYEETSIIWNNIYVSCLLTFLNSVTLSNCDLKKLKTTIYNKCFLRIVDNGYIKESKDCVILYHLPDDMKDYIKILVTKIKHLIAQDLSYKSTTYIPSNMTMQMLLEGDLEEDNY